MYLMAPNKILIFITLFSLSTQAQTFTKYWVRLKDKNGSPYSISNPSAYLSAKSIQRRVAQNITIDLTDIPVNQTYVNQINATGAQVFQRSKWFNAVVVIVSNASQLTAINSLTCVLGSAPLAMKKITDYRLQIIDSENESQKTAICNTSTKLNNNLESATKYSTLSTYNSALINNYNYGPSLTQVSQIGVDCMHDLGFRGNNMVIGVMDSGFDQVNVNPVFDSLRNENRIIGTRDFVAGNNSVYEDHSHGAMVLSCISGNSPSNLIGTAPKSDVWLFRTEDIGSEKIIEEHNWVIAAEFADSVGVDIVTTSLGYNSFDNSVDNHSYADLDGKTSVMSKASTMAARKGIFVLNAAGNEGSSAWQKIICPADADSICTVGSVDGSGLHSSFSSVGPTADGRIKPDVSTMGGGTYICAPGYNFFGANGTSFATPVMAGAVACLWQANPTKTNMEILQAIKATASQSVTPDNNYGWGIPNICAAHQYLASVGLQDYYNDQTISFYPNPTENKVYFNLETTPENIEIKNILGQKINFEYHNLQNNKYVITFDNSINKGVYSVLIKTKNNLLNGKIIKH